MQIVRQDVASGHGERGGRVAGVVLSKPPPRASSEYTEKTTVSGTTKVVATMLILVAVGVSGFVQACAGAGASHTCCFTGHGRDHCSVWEGRAKLIFAGGCTARPTAGREGLC